MAAEPDLLSLRADWRRLSYLVSLVAGAGLVAWGVFVQLAWLFARTRLDPGPWPLGPVLLIFIGLELRGRRLVMDARGITLVSPFSGRRHVAWADVVDVRDGTAFSMNRRPPEIVSLHLRNGESVRVYDVFPLRGDDLRRRIRHAWLAASQ